MSVNAGERNVPDTPQNRQLDACWKARDECYKCWKNNAEKGNSYKLIQRMDNYLKELRKDENNGS